ncbi:mobile mystery protein B [Phenylobacterium sp.]|uniref:mobile mystery protein B n=1 Tax=Phenylobacterium sp. TaxID=1871053 RepID=UPI002FCA5E92
MTDWLADAQGDGAATPLTPAEREGLIPTYITNRAELNEAEQLNILEADTWAFRRKRDVLDHGLLVSLHKRMLGKVWRWAGAFSGEVNRRIGVDYWLIEAELRQLLDDVRYWAENQTFPPDEIAVRFHHRLVVIHPFPNGNGRLSRLASDLLAVQLGQERFTWGRAILVEAAETRRLYVAALRAADMHDIGPLLAFARS